MTCRVDIISLIYNQDIIMGSLPLLGQRTKNSGVCH